VWPVSGCPLGTVLCTRWPKRDHTIYTLLEMTKDHDLAMVDLQLRQVFDLRGRVEATVTIANGTKLPYLTEPIVRAVMAHQQHYGDYLIAGTSENTYMQALCEDAQPARSSTGPAAPTSTIRRWSMTRNWCPSCSRRGCAAARRPTCLEPKRGHAWNCEPLTGVAPGDATIETGAGVMSPRCMLVALTALTISIMAPRSDPIPVRHHVIASD
jgi:hypothetical protein